MDSQPTRGPSALGPKDPQIVLISLADEVAPASFICIKVTI